MPMLRFLPLMLCLAVAPVLAAGAITGTATVIDGDTIEIHGERIRMQGIDAPESRQLCKKDGKRYLCGKDAANALAGKIGRQTVACEPHETDKYGRTVATCRAGGADLGQWMVGQGHALAYRKYSMAYVADEAAAKTAKRGIWAGTFENPSNWRHRPHAKGEGKSERRRNAWKLTRKPAWVRGYYRHDGTYVRGHFRWR